MICPKKVLNCGYGFTDCEVTLVMLKGLPKDYEELILNLERDKNGLPTKVAKLCLVVEEKKLSRHLENSH